MQVEDRVYAQYYRDVARTQMPRDAQEERVLFERYHQTGDPEARRLIVEGGLRFVIKTARQYHRGNTEFLKTLIAAGNVGLLIAVDRYKPWLIACPRCKKKNYVAQPKKQRCASCNRALRHSDAERYKTRFLTYAAWWISLAIKDTLYESSLIHIPTYRQKGQFRAQNPDKAPQISYVSYDELIDADEVIAHRTLTRTVQVDDQDALTIMHARRVLHSVLGEMKDRYAYVIIAYYGLREDPKTLREIAQTLGVCSERVRQLKVEAIRDLRKRLERRNITQTADAYLN